MDHVVNAAAEAPHIYPVVERLLKDHLRSRVVDVATEVVSLQQLLEVERQSDRVELEERVAHRSIQDIRLVSEDQGSRRKDLESRGMHISVDDAQLVEFEQSL